MIYLHTGQPGHGKTLLALQKSLEERDKGRLVFAHGIPGLDQEKTKFLDLPNPREWEKLPDNAVIFIDECYTVFPNRSAQSSVPSYVEALARHRHRGFDFILVCQLGNQIDPFLRGLVDKHYHVRRKFGLPTSVIKEWDHYQPDPLKMDSSNRVWRLPKKIMKVGYYKSTTQDSTKRRVPWYFIAGPLLLAYVGYVFWQISHGSLFGDDEKEVAAKEAEAAKAAKPAAEPNGATKVKTVDDLMAELKPRIPAIPWSAPIFDARTAMSEPLVACMSTDESCSCMTEQGTQYLMPDLDCRKIARNGPAYNPFLRANNQQLSEAPGESRVKDVPAPTPLTAPTLTPEAPAGGVVIPGRVIDMPTGQAAGSANSAS